MKLNILVMVSVVSAWTKAGSHPYKNEDKIAGGSIVTDIRAAPYVVNIQTRDPFSQDETWGTYAAGTIFSPLYVITACHIVAETDDAGNIVPLVQSYPLRYWRFIAGTANVARMAGSHQSRTPASLVYHPECQLEKNGTPYLRNDVALAKMAEPFEIGDYVKPVRFFGLDRQTFDAGVNKIVASRNALPRQESPVCKVAGWGATERITILEQFGLTTTTLLPGRDGGPGEMGNQLKSLEMFPMDDGQCFPKFIEALKAGLGPHATLLDKSAEEEYRQILLGQLCASSRSGDESTCQGDSGSGLVCNGYYIGVTSWGVGCGAGAPEVFQSLSGTMDWLKKQVCAVQSCLDALNIHEKCDPPDSGFLKKCQDARGMAAAPGVTFGLAYLASSMN